GIDRCYGRHHHGSDHQRPHDHEGRHCDLHGPGMRPIDPAWRASASHAPPAMSKRAATKGLMCERDDWVPFGGAACLLLMIFLHTRLSWPHPFRSRAASPAWLDILIHMEQIARII